MNGRATHSKRKLTFTVQEDGKDKEFWKAPRWTEAEVENAFCPNCSEEMTVVLTGTIFYAHCAGPKGCGKYFIGE